LLEFHFLANRFITVGAFSPLLRFLWKLSRTYTAKALGRRVLVLQRTTTLSTPHLSAKRETEASLPDKERDLEGDFFPLERFLERLALERFLLDFLLERFLLDFLDGIVIY
jgi:hypothetical protein